MIGSERLRPLVSIVTVVRNDAERLRRTLESVSLQRIEGGSGFEHVIFDGSSSDETPAVASAYAAGRPEVHFMSARDHGIYDAMNRAAELCRGKYLYFLNAGDKFHGDRALAGLLSSAASLGSSWAVFPVVHLGARGRVISPIPFGRFRFVAGRQPYNHQGTMMDRQMFLGLRGFAWERFGYMADAHLIARISLVDAPAEIPVVVAEYEGSGVSASLSSRFPRIMHAIRCDLFRLRGPLRAASYALGWLQTARRAGLSNAHRIMQSGSAGSFDDPRP